MSASDLTRVVATAALLLAGCASGTNAEIGEGPDEDGPDAGAVADAAPEPDAPVPDAAITELTLTHSASNDVLPEASVRCNDNETGAHTENSYYRVFDLDAEGVAGDFLVEEVSIGIQEALAGGGAGEQPASVRLHVLDGDFVVDNMTLLGGVDIDVADQSLTTLTVPVVATAPAGSVLVVELFTPSGEDTVSTFWAGVNGAGQTGPSYVRSGSCGIDEPTDIAELPIDGFDTSTVHLVMSVTGTEVLP